MKTHFASPERMEEANVKECVDLLGSNKLISALLQASGGVLAVLNEQRQVLAINSAFLRELGVHDAGNMLGLRFGEIVN